MDGTLPITQIGSLPFENMNQAVNYSLRHGIPFIPEVPKIDGYMLDWIKNLKNSCLDQFAQNRFGTVKIQAPGPAVLIQSGYEESQAVEKILGYVSEVIEKLNAEKIILFLDEPALGQAGFNYEELWAPIFLSFPVIPGIHCCGNMDWDILFKSPTIQIISFDASQYDITKYPHYRNGKRIAWGIEKKEDVKDFQKGDMISPPCGLSPLKYTPADCEMVFQNLQQIARKLIRHKKEEK